MDVTSEDKVSKSERLKLPTAKWGAACAACSMAKAKCIRSNEEPGSKCDRCERLLKDCTAQIHRPRKKRQSKPSRTAQIEERLNGLVSLLQASGELPSSEPGARDGTHDSTTDSEHTVSPENTPSTTTTTSAPHAGGKWFIPETYNAYAPAACICRPESGDAPPPPETDEVSLEVYRRELQRLHPFVIIPQNVTATQLRETRPFVMASIRMVTSYRSLRSMRAQKYHLMRHIADHMLIRSEKSLDLLLGIIIILGWYQYHCFMHAQLTNLIALATSLVGELGLNKYPDTRYQPQTTGANPSEPPQRTNDERRALAGVWFLSSSMSLFFQKSDPMRYSSYVQDCVKKLETDAEYETDAILVFLVRIQHLTERIAELNSKDTAAEEIVGFPTAPTSAYVSAFQSEINRIRNNLPPNLKNDGILQIYLNTATLRLYEPPVVDTAFIVSISESLISRTVGPGTPLDKIYQTSSALRAWFDGWLGVPVNVYYYQTTSVASLLVYALIMLGRWARFATPKTMYEGEKPTPQDSAAANSAMRAFDQEPFRPPPKANSTTEQGHGDGAACNEPDAADPNLPVAVASLREQLSTQPGLTVNIAEILKAIGARFEQANATFQIASTESGKMDNNVWSMTALKIRVTRAKLERWAELVSAGAQALSLESKEQEDTNMGDWRAAGSNYPQPNVQTGFDASGNAMPMSSLPQGQLDLSNFQGSSTPWTSDLLAGVDPSVWFDGYLDWGAVIMNSMGTVEQ